MKECVLRLPPNVFFGPGSLDRIPGFAKGFARAAVFTDEGVQHSGVLEEPLLKLAEAGVKAEMAALVPPEPTWEQAQEAVDHFSRLEADLVVAVGGGSVIDVAKLASVVRAGSGVRDLLERPELAKKRAVVLAVPTTAGTGAEATKNAIVAVPERKVKVGIVSEEMTVDGVVLDGTMTRTLPRQVAASTGIDALCHAVECYTSNKATPFSDLFAMEAMRLIFANLEESCNNSGALEAKSAMLLAAFYAGAAIATSGTTAVHALSYPLGGRYHIPHGVANAMLLAPVMRFNLPFCGEELARVCSAVGGAGGTAGERARWVVDRMEEMVRGLDIPSSLSAFGIGDGDLEDLVDSGLGVQRLLVNNKRPVTREDARELYRSIMG